MERKNDRHKNDDNDKKKKKKKEKVLLMMIIMEGSTDAFAVTLTWIV